tara:strand:+ start:1050 stop:1385 length:336 start_codon:yes stop_codon:yes gene_type:complete
MTWKDILKESMARDLSEQYGRDYIDTLISQADDDYEKAVAESVAYLINNKLVTKDDGIGKIEELLEKHENDIQVPVYGGKMDISLNEMLSEYRSLAESVSREVDKILTPKK